MKMEDLVICKAFISTSEDPITGKQLQFLMSMTYDKLIKNQFREDKCKYNKAPESLNAFMPVPVPYQEQSSKVHVNSFQENSIFLKFMRIKNIIPMESGKNQEDLIQQRYLYLRNLNNNYQSCKEYLESNPEWLSYSRMMNKSNNKEVSPTPASTGQPTRNKNMKTASDEKEMIVKVKKEVGFGAT